MFIIQNTLLVVILILLTSNQSEMNWQTIFSLLLVMRPAGHVCRDRDSDITMPLSLKNNR